MPPNEQTMTRESETFCPSDADVVLKSSDSVRFGLYRRILSESSPFFKDMFSLPQMDPPCTGSSVQKSEVDFFPPVVAVSESSEVLDALLRFVYPGEDPEVETLDELSVALAAALKYDVARAITILRRMLVSPRFVEKDPLRVYSIACRFDLETESQIAASYTLSVNLLECPLTQDLKYMTAWSYRRLLDLHRRRADAAVSLLAAADTDELAKCPQCSAAHYGSLSPPRWWKLFLTRAEVELRARPTSAVIFSMKFLSEVGQVGQTGCTYCPVSILESHEFLEKLKKAIDELPSTM